MTAPKQNPTTKSLAQSTMEAYGDIKILELKARCLEVAASLKTEHNPDRLETLAEHLYRWVKKRDIKE